MPLLPHEEVVMRDEVLKHIDFGMPIEQAMIVMRSHGFECQYDHELPTALHRPPDAGRVLFCTRSWPYSFWDSFFMSTTIQVVIFFEDGKVKDVVCHTDACCV